MQDSEKFKDLKGKLLEENEKQYKEEVVQRWGEDSYEKSKDYFTEMSETQFNYYQQLGEEIIQKLLVAFQTGNNPKSKEAQHVAKLHQEWIRLSWGRYDEEAHLNLVDMYLEDKRFKEFYDSHQTGLAQLLHDAVYTMLTK